MVTAKSASFMPWKNLNRHATYKWLLQKNCYFVAFTIYILTDLQLVYLFPGKISGIYQYMGKEYTRNKNQKIYHIEKLIYRKKNRTLCSLWILEGNKCYLRLLIVTAPAYHKTGVTISKEKPEWKKESTSYTNHCISTYSISPQEKKSFLISRGEAHEERLLTLTFLICGKNTTKNFHGSFSYHSHIFMNCLAASSH